MTGARDNQANELLVAYSYDANGNMTEKKMNGRTMITSYEYNESNLPKKMSNQTIADPIQNIKGTYSEYNYTYYLDGNQSSVTDIFGKTKSYTYDGAGRLKRESNYIKGRDSEQKPEVEMETYYHYDARGNRTSKFDTKSLTSTFDWHGSRPSYGKGEGGTSYYYDDNNILISCDYDYEDYMNRDYKYTYDENGNMTSRHKLVFYDDFAPSDYTYMFRE